MKRLELRFVRPRDLTPGHRAGVLIGLTLIVVGALGLVFGWGSSTTTTRRATRPTAETPQAFLAAFTKAVHDGDRAFLFDRFDDAVIARYGAEQCRSITAQLVDPTADLHLVSVSGPAPFVYSSDGRSVTVPQTFAFRVQGTVRGRLGTREFHFALRQGHFRIFAACGTPVSGS